MVQFCLPWVIAYDHYPLGGIKHWFKSISPWYNSSDHGSLDMRTTNVQELNLGLILFAGFLVEVYFFANRTLSLRIFPIFLSGGFRSFTAAPWHRNANETVNWGIKSRVNCLERLFWIKMISLESCKTTSKMPKSSENFCLCISVNYEAVNM